MTKDELLTAIKEMSVLELSELVKALEEEFGCERGAANDGCDARHGYGCCGCPRRSCSRRGTD